MNYFLKCTAANKQQWQRFLVCTGIFDDVKGGKKNPLYAFVCRQLYEPLNRNSQPTGSTCRQYIPVINLSTGCRE